MAINDDFEKILAKSHFWNWSPDLDVVQKVYSTFNSSFSVLLPFAYLYLEEVIRSLTSDYGNFDEDSTGKIRRHLVGKRLIKQAIKENKDNETLINLLNLTNSYFDDSKPSDQGNNRNNVLHGYVPPRFWYVDSFEKIIHLIAELSDYARF